MSGIKKKLKLVIFQSTFLGLLIVSFCYQTKIDKETQTLCKNVKIKKSENEFLRYRTYKNVYI